MSHHGGTEHGTGAPAGHGIHLPPPSLAPVIIGVGVSLICFGLLYSVPLLAVGGVITVGAIVLWLVEDARSFVAAGEPQGDGDHGAHH